MTEAFVAFWDHDEPVPLTGVLAACGAGDGDGEEVDPILFKYKKISDEVIGLYEQSKSELVAAKAELAASKAQVRELQRKIMTAQARSQAIFD